DHASVQQFDDPLQVRTVTADSRPQYCDIRSRLTKSIGFWRDPDQTSARPQGAVRTRLNLAPDSVEHHVAVRDDLREVLAVAVARAVGSEAANIVYIGGVRRGDYGCSQMFRQLNCEASHTARATLDQNHFASPELCRVLDCPDGCDADQRHARGLQVRQA